MGKTTKKKRGKKEEMKLAVLALVCLAAVAMAAPRHSKHVADWEKELDFDAKSTIDALEELDLEQKAKHNKKHPAAKKATTHHRASQGRIHRFMKDHEEDDEVAS